MNQASPVFELRVVITADDYQAAVRFYRDILGLPLIRDFDGPGGGGSLLAAGTATVEVLAKAAAAEVDQIEIGKPGVGGLRLALEVADAAEVAADLTEAGASSIGSVVTTPWGHTNVRLKTPDGIQITLFTVQPEDGN